MQIGVSTACFYPKPLEEGVEEIISLGADTMEVFCNTESEFDPSFAREIGRRLQDAGVSVASVHPYTSPMEGQLLLSPYARRTEDGMRQYGRYFEAARLLGARSLTFHGERAVVRDVDQADLERKIDAYRRLSVLATEYGLTLAQENVAWCKSAEPSYLAMLRDQVPALGFTLDVKQARRAGRHWSEYLHVCGKRLTNVHINDFDETHSCMLPGEGVMDYTDFFAQLAGLGYDKQVVVEVYESDYTHKTQIARALRHLRGTLEKHR